MPWQIQLNCVVIIRYLWIPLHKNSFYSWLYFVEIAFNQKESGNFNVSRGEILGIWIECTMKKLFFLVWTIQMKPSWKCCLNLIEQNQASCLDRIQLNCVVIIRYLWIPLQKHSFYSWLCFVEIAFNQKDKELQWSRGSIMGIWMRYHEEAFLSGLDNPNETILKMLSDLDERNQADALTESAKLCGNQSDSLKTIA